LDATNGERARAFYFVVIDGGSWFDWLGAFAPRLIAEHCFKKPGLPGFFVSDFYVVFGEHAGSFSPLRRKTATIAELYFVGCES
jgi:hypothetical protein